MNNLYKIAGILLLGVLAAVAGIFLTPDPTVTPITTENETNVATDESVLEVLTEEQKRNSQKKPSSHQGKNSSSEKISQGKGSSKKAEPNKKLANDTAVENKTSTPGNTSKEKTKPAIASKTAKKKTEAGSENDKTSKKSTKKKTASTDGTNRSTNNYSDSSLAHREKELESELNSLINDIDKEFIEVDRTNEGLAKEYKQLESAKGLLSDLNVSPNEQKVLAEYLNTSYKSFNTEKQGYFRSIRESEETSQQFLNDMANLNQEIIDGAADQTQKKILKQILDSQYNSMKRFADKVSAQRGVKAQ